MITFRTAVALMLFPLYVAAPFLAGATTAPSTASSGPSIASQPAEASPIVATIMGRSIRLSEIDLSETDRARLPRTMTAEEADAYRNRYRVEQLHRLIIVPLREQYVREHHLEPTREELAAATAAIREQQTATRNRNLEERQKLEEQLRSPELKPEQRSQLRRKLDGLERSIQIDDEVPKRRAESARHLAALQEERRTLTIRLASDALAPKERERLSADLGRLDRAIEMTGWLGKDIPQQLADMFVGPWKFHRSLHARYGGMVIYQQTGVEAVGAVRAWLEEHEAAGHFAVLDPGLRHDFWHYYVRGDHPARATEPNPFQILPWLRSVAAARPAPR